MVDFFEEDEPTTEVAAAFEQGRKRFSERPDRSTAVEVVKVHVDRSVSQRMSLTDTDVSQSMHLSSSGIAA